jgi:phosphoribosylformylglycinamidine cyclo-ligase
LGDAATDAAVADAPQEMLATLGEVLLTPTRIYSRAVLAVREGLTKAGHDIRGAAHITGGGLPGNVPRALPDGLGSRLDPRRWSIPSVQRLFGALGGMDDAELRATFNGGLGMVLIVPPGAISPALRILEAQDVPAAVVGEVVEVEALDGARYVEGRLESVA